MAKYKNNIFSYILIVIIPLFIFSIVLFKYNEQLKQSRAHEHAEWISSVYQKEMNHFLIETKTLIETLSISFQCENHSAMYNPTLKKIEALDPRYSGIYCVDVDGNILSKSNDIIPIKSLKDFSFFQRILVEKETAISQQEVVLNNHQEVFVIASPILNENNDIEQILIAFLNTDYIKNIMKVLTPNEHVKIMNMRGEKILETDENEPDIKSQSAWVEYPFELLPWSMAIKVNESNEVPISYFQIFLVGGIVFTTLNLLFFLKQNLRLRRKAKRELERSEKEKLQLIGTLAASTAHEIRNPLTGIKGLIQLLSEKHSNEEDQFYFSVIDKEIQRINQIVNEFLILGKPTEQKMKPIDLIEVVEEIKPVIESEAQIYNVTCTMEVFAESLYVKGISDQVKQILFNITRNALEAMESGGHLTVQIEDIDHSAIITVIDTGVGIENEDLERIFEPFHTTKHDGTGLGLVICQKIVESFGGKISITSKINEGTTVKIILPKENGA